MSRFAPKFWRRHCLHTPSIFRLDAEFELAEGAPIRLSNTQPLAVVILRGTRPGVVPMLLFEVEPIAVPD